MANTAKAVSPARDRILATAADLFYKQGYRATGVNEIIKHADVAKATFFAHFPSKEDLCMAYLKEMSLSGLTGLKAAVEQFSSPYERFFAFMDAVEGWLNQNDYRGCPFLHIISEVPDPDNELNQQAMVHYEQLRSMIRQLVADLVASEPKYKKLDEASLADSYMVIVIGAIGISEVYHNTWSVTHAKALLKTLIEA
jgi:AcrR family transcriptional regulator